MNETVNGFELSEDNFPWHLFPQDMPVVGDMSSNIATRKINWNRYSVVYAGAQKNMGPSGCSIIIVKKSLLGYMQKDTPVMCDWKAFEEAPGTYYNTPPCWAIYVTALNASYMNQRGGLSHYENIANIKSKMLYNLIDNSGGFYVNNTDKAYRSRINIIFRIPNNLALEDELIKECAKWRIINIKGHAFNPGVRISSYNAMPIEGVALLCKIMHKFQKDQSSFAKM